MFGFSRSHEKHFSFFLNTYCIRFANMGKKSKKKNKVVYQFDPTMDSLLLQGGLSVNKDWFIQYIAEYVSRIDQASSNQSMGELIREQIKIEKENQKVKYFSKSEQGFTLNSNEDIPRGSIALLNLKGMMRIEDTWYSKGVQSLCKEIQFCNSNPNVSAIVLQVNSGGGFSTAGQMLKNQVKDSHIPVVKYSHFSASAAEHGTAPSDHIMLAGNSTEVGSIGSMVTVNKRFIKWYNENYEDIYSKVSPKKNHEFRELLKGNKGPLLEGVTNNAISFQNEMKKFRKLDPTTQEDTLKGGMFQASEAIKRGLADSIGTLNDAIKMADKLANNNKSKNSNTMNYKASWIALVATLNTLFGTSYDNSESANPETVNSEMNLANVMESLKQTVVTETNKTMNTLIEVQKQSIVDLTAKVKKLEESQNTTDEELTKKVDELEVKYSALSDQNVKLVNEKKDIEKQLANIQGNQDAGTAGSGDDAANTAPPTPKESSLAKFNEQLNELQEVEGESTY